MTVLAPVFFYLAVAAGSDLYPAGFWAALDHDVGFAETDTDLHAIEWPEGLRDLEAVVLDLGGDASGNVSRRMVRIHFSGVGRTTEWYEAVAARARAVPGVLDAVCLPPVPMPGTSVFVTEEVVLPRPMDHVLPESIPCPTGTVMIDLVVDTHGTTRDPVLAAVSRDTAPDCARALMEWVKGLRWECAYRPNGLVPVSLSLPVRIVE